MSQDFNSYQGSGPDNPSGMLQPSSGIQQPVWGTSQQPFGPYNSGRPAGRKKPFLLFFVIGVLALIVVLTLLIGSVVTVNNLLGRSDAAVTLLSTATTNLSNTPGTRYVGTITNSGGDKIQADLEATNKGSTYGTLIQDGERLEVLAIDNKTFLKASESFWSKQRVPQESVGAYAKQWVKVPASVIGIDIQKILAPGTLGQRLSQTAKSHQITLGPETIVNGIQTRKVTTLQGTLYITTDAPQQIVRIEGTPASTLDSHTQNTMRVLPALFGAMALNPGYEFDLSDLSPSQLESLYEQLRQKIQDLKNSIDSEVHFNLSGQGTLSPCDTSGCTATLTISNRVTFTSPYLQVNQPVTVSITINFTLDGLPVGECPPIIKTMPPNGETSVQCSVSYSIPPSRNPTMHNILAMWRAFAQAMISADVERIIKDLVAEQTRVQEREAEETKFDKAANAVVRTTKVKNKADLDELKKNSPSREHPPTGIGPDDELWNDYIKYWNKQIRKLAKELIDRSNAEPDKTDKTETDTPLKWKDYQDLQSKLSCDRQFQSRVTDQLITEAKNAGWDLDIRGDVGVGKKGESTSYADQLVVDNAKVKEWEAAGKPTNQVPEVETYSDKSCELKNIADKGKQVNEDVRDIADKYGGELEIRLPDHPLFGYSTRVRKVTLVYDATWVPSKADQDEIVTLAKNAANGLSISLEVEFRK